MKFVKTGATYNYYYL